MNSFTDNVKYLKEVELKLRKGRVVSAKAEAEIFVQHYGKMKRFELYAGDKKLSPAARNGVERAVARRVKGEPLQHILGEAPFYGLMFAVSPDSLIPRPETELLVEEAARLLGEFKGKNPQILDVGTGSGCLAVCLTISRADCRMTALDISAKALKIARKNIGKHGLSKKIRLIKGDLFDAFPGGKKPVWDLVVSNPPYIPTKDLKSLPREVRAEPMLALDGGEKGTRHLESLLDSVAATLKPGGWFLAEIGEGQSKRLAKKILKDGAFEKPRFIRDYAGIDRILVVRKPTV